MSARQVSIASETKLGEGLGGFDGELDLADEFARSVASIGDLDGDGVGDLAVGSMSDDDGGLDKGAVWILFMNADGTVGSTQKISATEGNFGGGLGTSDQFGVSVAPLGDFDGDSVPDIVVGAYGSDDGGTNSGSIWLLFLNADGTVKSHQKISKTQGGMGVLPVGSDFGGAVATLGDLDGDGTTDLAVGAHYDDDGGPDAGAVWVLFLNANGTVGASAKTTVAQTAGDWFGTAVTAIGDVDGDGTLEIAVGAPRDDDGGSDRGAVWIFSMDPNGTSSRGWKISSTAGGFAAEIDDDCKLGFSVSAPGDLDGDGVPDLVVGAQNMPDGGPFRGAVFVLYLNADATVKAHQKFSDTEGSFDGTLADGDRFGSSTAWVDAFDGGTQAGLLVGTPGETDDNGSAWMLLLDTADLLFESEVGVGETATFDFGEGGGPTAGVQVEFTNDAGTGAEYVSVTAQEAGATPTDSVYGLLDQAVLVETGLQDGAFHMTLSVPFAAEALGGANPELLDLAYFDTDLENWVLAVEGNVANSPGHSTPVGDRFVVFDTVEPVPLAASAELGDYGVFWNTSTGKGYVWANLDHTTEFAAGLFGLVQYGCGVNPDSSLAPLSGSAALGETLVVGVDDPLGASPPGSLALLLASVLPDPSFPCGTPLPGYGMAGPTGELLVSVLPPNPVVVLGPAVWAGPGAPASISIPIPADASLEGLSLFLQGVMAGVGSTKLTDGLRITVGG